MGEGEALLPAQQKRKLEGPFPRYFEILRSVQEKQAVKWLRPKLWIAGSRKNMLAN